MACCATDDCGKRHCPVCRLYDRFPRIRVCLRTLGCGFAAGHAGACLVRLRTAAHTNALAVRATEDSTFTTHQQGGRIP